MTHTQTTKYIMSRNIGLSLPKQVRPANSEGRAAAELSSSKNKNRRRCSNSLSEMARSGSCAALVKTNARRSHGASSVAC